MTLKHISKKQCIFHREIADRQWLDCIIILDRLPRCHKGTRTKATSAPPKPKVLARRRVLRGKGWRAPRLLLAAPCSYLVLVRREGQLPGCKMGEQPWTMTMRVLTAWFPAFHRLSRSFALTRKTTGENGHRRVFDGTLSFAAQICHPLEGVCARGVLKGFSARGIWFRWKEKLRKWREDRPARRIAFRWNAVLRGIQAARST